MPLPSKGLSILSRSICRILRFSSSTARSRTETQYGSFCSVQKAPGSEQLSQAVEGSAFHGRCRCPRQIVLRSLPFAAGGGAAAGAARGGAAGGGGGEP